MGSLNGPNFPDAHEDAYLEPSHSAKLTLPTEAALSKEVNIFLLENSIKTSPKLAPLQYSQDVLYQIFASSLEAQFINGFESWHSLVDRILSELERVTHTSKE